MWPKAQWATAEWATAERASDLLGAHTLGHGTPSLNGRASLTTKGSWGLPWVGPSALRAARFPRQRCPRGNLGSYHQKEGLRP